MLGFSLVRWSSSLNILQIKKILLSTSTEKYFNFFSFQTSSLLLSILSSLIQSKYQTHTHSYTKIKISSIIFFNIKNYLIFFGVQYSREKKQKFPQRRRIISCTLLSLTLFKTTIFSFFFFLNNPFIHGAD